MEKMGENRDQGQGWIYGVPKWIKRGRKKITQGLYKMKMEQGGTRLGPGNWMWRNKLEFWYGVT